MVKPVIFLDIDGVLNTHGSIGQDPIEPFLLARLADFADEIDADVVISSSWRILYDRLQFIDKFDADRLGKRIHQNHCTGRDPRGFRGNEVVEWLSANGWPPHIIFDDDSDFYEFQPLVLTNPTTGLSGEDLVSARIHLERQKQYPILNVGGVGYANIDLLKVRTKIIAHGCNAQGVMGKGVAKAIRDRWPECYETYRRHYAMLGNYLEMGSVVWFNKVGTPISEDPWIYDREHIIANVITQKYYGRCGPDKRYVDYDAIRKGMTTVAEVAITHNQKEVALPMIGAGLGGGDWTIIARILEEIGLANDVRFTVCIPDQQIFATTNQLRVLTNDDDQERSPEGA